MVSEHPDPEIRAAENHPGNSPETITGLRIISYNLRETERPGGLKTRFKVRIETGKKARALDARQAEAIRELMEWTGNSPSTRRDRRTG
jgi:hypothetical protein